MKKQDKARQNCEIWQNRKDSNNMSYGLDICGINTFHYCR